MYGRGARTRVAIDQLTFSVPKGTVFGLIGPNGAGKTTTLRILLGLVRPSGGSCRILGVSPARGNLRAVVDRVGVVQEYQKFFPTLSGRSNLGHLTSIRGFDPILIDEVLDLVGLSQAADLSFAKYSLGMKQRLGIAAALLKDPELLILDEPSNGLDPRGLVEVRELLHAMAERGKTIFLCSHLLTEVQAVCDWVAFISEGKCVASGEIVSVLQSLGKAAMVLHVQNLEQAASVLLRAGFDLRIEDSTIRIQADSGEAIARTLAEAGIYPQELRRDSSNLEDIFMSVVPGE